MENGHKAESHVDVLIIGAGPAGLMMAEWMAKCGINTRIVDKRGTKVSAESIQSSKTPELIQRLARRFSMVKPMVCSVVRLRYLIPSTSRAGSGMKAIICLKYVSGTLMKMV